VLGGGLNDLELRQRSLDLNAWMKALLQNYEKFESTVQNEIKMFFGTL
jgi:hypothetical protein